MSSHVTLGTYQAVTLAQLPIELRESADVAWQELSNTQLHKLSDIKSDVQLLFALSPFVTKVALSQPDILALHDGRVVLDLPESYPEQVRSALNECGDEVIAQTQLRRLRQR